MLFDHPLVVVGRDRGETLRQQVVVGEAPLHLDDLTLLAEVLDVVNEQEFNATAFALGQATAGCFDTGGFFRGHDSTPDAD
jgi:hypothetical protein